MLRYPIHMSDVKMVKYTDDECYGVKYNQIEQCSRCWIKESCHATYKSDIKKKAAAKRPPKPREKKYKKTDKHRDW